MEYILFTLAGVSVTLFLLSFFMNDRFKHMDSQLEQLSISSVQEFYLLKKKIKVLEEELLTEDLNQDWSGMPSLSQEQHPPLVESIKRRQEMDSSERKVTEKTTLSKHDIHSLLQQRNRNSRSEKR